MEVLDWLAVAASFAAIGWFVKVMLTGDGERHEEEDARAFFDEHGHWPDEDPRAATEQAFRRD